MPTRTRARRLPAEERRRQILDAAVGVFARKAFSDAGTADIAAAAAIGEPTIYRYFTDKRDLYIAAVTRSRDEIKQNWETIISETDDPLMAISLIGRWYCDSLRDHPEHLLLRLRALTETEDPETVALVRETYLELQGMVRGLYEQAGAVDSAAQDGDADTRAWLFMAIGALLDLTFLLGLPEDVRERRMESIDRLMGLGIGAAAEHGETVAHPGGTLRVTESRE